MVTQLTKQKKLKKNQLFGIELDKEIYALACANMLIHKDGKTNLEQFDSRSEEAKKWIKSKRITKVLMNPPFENKYGCIDIVTSVLESVDRDTICAFIMPDNKLETHLKKTKKILQKHTLSKIIKLPNEIFSGTTASIFIFKSGIPQNNNKIFACTILDDGLETIKNQGRQDIKNKWEEIEKYWVDVIYKQSGDNSIQWLDPNDKLSYKIPEKPFSISQKNFKKSVLDYILFSSNINHTEFADKILDYVLYDNSNDKKFVNILRTKITRNTEKPNIDISKWKKFPICGKEGIFKLIQPKARKLTEYLNDGEVPFVASGAFNNGIEKYVETTEILDKKNCITVSAIGGFSFYQSKDFIGRGGAGSAIKILYSDKLNEKNALFICAILQKILSKFDYTTMLSGDKLKKEFIYLPVNKDGQPDFVFMENYTENLQKELKMWV